MKRLLLLGLAACRGKHPVKHDAAPKPRDAAIDATSAWPELASIAKVEAVRVVALPVKPGVPRFDLGGPVVLGDVAVVASSQFGFLGVDYHDGHIAWTKPAGEHIAPPVVTGGSVALVGDCLDAQPVHDVLLGCVRIVTATGADQGYLAVHGKGLEAFASEPGEPHTWAIGDHAIRWRRGDAAVDVDLMTGLAKPAPAQEPAVVVSYKQKTYAITQDEDGTSARQRRDHVADDAHVLAADRRGILPEQAPMMRAPRTPGPTQASPRSTCSISMRPARCTARSRSRCPASPSSGTRSTRSATPRSPFASIVARARLHRRLRRERAAHVGVPATAPAAPRSGGRRDRAAMRSSCSTTAIRSRSCPSCRHLLRRQARRSAPSENPTP